MNVDDDDFVPDDDDDEDEEGESEEEEEEDGPPHDGVLEGGVAEPVEPGKSRRTAAQADIVRSRQRNETAMCVFEEHARGEKCVVYDAARAGCSCAWIAPRRKLSIVVVFYD